MFFVCICSHKYRVNNSNFIMPKNDNPTISADDQQNGQQRISKALEIALAEADTRCLVFFVVYVHFRRPFGITTQHRVQQMPSAFNWSCWFINSGTNQNSRQ